MLTKQNKRRATANYFNGSELASAMMPTDRQLPNGQRP